MKSTTLPELTIVIPCYNEEGCIELVIRDWVTTIASKVRNFEFVIVNDGSQDRSGEILDTLAFEIHELRIFHQPNAGHGAALRKGLEHARGEWVFHVDSDNQFLSLDFWKLWNLRSEYEYLCGVRTQRHDPFHRLLITRLVRFLIFLYFGTSICDANIPYKLVRKSELGQLLALISPNVFAPSIFMTVAAARWFRFKEIPVTHLPRETGKVSIMRWNLIKACLRSTVELAAFRSVLRIATPPASQTSRNTNLKRP